MERWQGPTAAAAGTAGTACARAAAAGGGGGSGLPLLRPLGASATTQAAPLQAAPRWRRQVALCPGRWQPAAPRGSSARPLPAHPRQQHPGGAATAALPEQVGHQEWQRARGGGAVLQCLLGSASRQDLVPEVGQLVPGRRPQGEVSTARITGCACISGLLALSKHGESLRHPHRRPRRPPACLPPWHSWGGWGAATCIGCAVPSDARCRCVCGGVLPAHLAAHWLTSHWLTLSALPLGRSSSLPATALKPAVSWHDTFQLFSKMSGGPPSVALLPDTLHAPLLLGLPVAGASCGSETPGGRQRTGAAAGAQALEGAAIVMPGVLWHARTMLQPQWSTMMQRVLPPGTVWRGRYHPLITGTASGGTAERFLGRHATVAAAATAAELVSHSLRGGGNPPATHWGPFCRVLRPYYSQPVSPITSPSPILASQGSSSLPSAALGCWPNIQYTYVAPT